MEQATAATVERSRSKKPRIEHLAPNKRTGAERWRARWYASGAWGKEVFRTEREAKAKLLEVDMGKAAGTYTPAASGRQKLRDYFAAWFASRDLEEATRALYEVQWRLHIAPALGNVQLKALNRERVKSWIADMREEGVGARTIAASHGLLRAVLAEALIDGKIGSNPAAKVEVPKPEPREMRVLDASQLAALADAIPPRDRALVLLLGYGGLRVGEAAALRVSDLDLMRGKVTIARSMAEVGGRLIVGSPKTDRVRTVTLPRFLVAELEAHLEVFGHPKERSSLVFTSATGTPFRLNAWRRRVFGPAQVAAGIVPEPGSDEAKAEGASKPIRVHDLRHSAAALAIEAGAHPKAIQEMLGHSKITTTLDTYGHLLPGLGDALADRLDETFREAAARPAAVAVSLNQARATREG